MEHPNVARARQALEAFTKRDLDAYSEFFAEDVVWHVGGYHPLSGDYKGRNALFGYFERVAELSGGTLRVEPLSILGSDRHLAMSTRATGSRAGHHLDVLLAQAFSIGADGKFTEYWALADDQEAVDRFWSASADT